MADKILVNCFNYSPENGFELRKTVQLPKLLTTPTNINKKNNNLFVGRSPFIKNEKQTINKKCGSEEDLNRKLKILKKIKDEDELERLRTLIEKWRCVGLEVLERMKDVAGCEDKLERLSEREAAQFMGINDPKILNLMFPSTSKEVEDENSSTKESDSEKDKDDKDDKDSGEFEYFKSSQ